MEFVLGVIVGALVCYAILRAGVNVRKLLLGVAIVIVALVVIIFIVAFPVTEELTRGEITEVIREIPLPEWLEEIEREKGDRN
ncbi:MAG: hypothetical protein DDT24_00854 [Chloroflexi bacterium]|nr:hypothetical protein [Chloroflexota bacterium]